MVLKRVYLRHAQIGQMKGYTMKTVNRYTRAGAGGKMIACPHCKTPVDKNDWFIACDCTSRGIGETCRTRQAVHA